MTKLIQDLLAGVMRLLGRPDDVEEVAVLPAPRRKPKTGQARPTSTTPARVPAAGKATVARQARPGGVVSPAPEGATETQVAVQQTAVVQAPPRATVAVKQGDGKDVAEILKYDCELMSGVGGSIELSDNHRSYVAAFSNGILVVARDNIRDPVVSGARSILARGGFKTKQIIAVDLTDIRKINESFEKRLGPVGNDDVVDMQRRIGMILEEASKTNCSDIRVRIDKNVAEISVRRDGVYRKVRDVHARIGQDLLRAAFFVADVSDSNYRNNSFQDARISRGGKLQLPDRVGSIRMAFAPLANDGRLLAMRLLYLDEEGSTSDIDDLGYSAMHIEQIKRMRRFPQGINVICGPTGSGKSTTLKKSLLALIRETRGEGNVLTVEDPPEYLIPGASQIPVTNAETATEREEEFRKAMASTLRLDPDTIMIGEIRDKQSGVVCFQAAMSGHGVWTTVHAIDALSILDRLRDLGVERFKLTDHTLLTGLVAQRLVRCLCRSCSVPITQAKDESARLAYDSLVKVVGPELAACARTGRIDVEGEMRCRVCDGDGYYGRTVVAETILPNARFMSFVAAEDKNGARKFWLESMNGLTMLEHGLAKVLSGQVDPRDLESKVGLIDEIDPTRVDRVLELLDLPRAKLLASSERRLRIATSIPEEDAA